MKKAFTEIPEGHIFYRFAGSGEPVLLIHQSPSSSEEYLGVIPVLANSFQVIAMDTLGYGLSDDPPRAYDIANYARSVISFLDSLGITQAHVVGHHTGASIAAEVGASYPKRVNKLVLSACPTLDKDDWQVLLQKIKAPPTFGQPMVLPNDDGSFLKQQWQQSKTGNPQMAPRDRVQSICSRLLTSSRPYSAILAVMQYNVKDRLPLIKLPTLVTGGDKDMLFPYLETTHKLVPKSQMVVIPEASAAIAREKPEEFANTIASFLSNS
jgi:pimeloyl-ACP methyl ester carboxylesterase